MSTLQNTIKISSDILHTFHGSWMISEVAQWHLCKLKKKKKNTGKVSIKRKWGNWWDLHGDEWQEHEGNWCNVVTGRGELTPDNLIDQGEIQMHVIFVFNLIFVNLLAIHWCIFSKVFMKNVNIPDVILKVRENEFTIH